jgi:hypothetical protein
MLLKLAVTSPRASPAFLVTLVSMQAMGYDPWSEKEVEMARKLNIPWDLRGPLQDDPKLADCGTWKGQKMRSSGRLSSRGGSKGWYKKMGKVWKFSGHSWYYSRDNQEGRSMH